jgi:CubicO group peptidase (beta-lactamase class C family)
VTSHPRDAGTEVVPPKDGSAAADSGGSSTDSVATPLTALLARARDARTFSGAAWSVGTAAGPVARGTLGTRAWDGGAVDDDTLWDLASVTKPIVGLAVMALVERGQLSLTDPIPAHLPAYARTDKADVTVWHLLTHTSGIPGQQPLFRLHPDRASLVAALAKLPPRHQPGTHVAYSSPGFMILGLVAEAAAGVPLDVLVEQAVTAPAGMTRTRFNPPPDSHDRAAATEDCPWRGHLVRGTVHDENAHVLGGVAAHAGLFSTIGDMEKLALALLRSGRGETGPIIAPRTLAVMTTPATGHLNLTRSLGWQGVDRSSTTPGDLLTPVAFGHTGFTGTSLWIDPDLGFYAVLLTNRIHPRRGSLALARLRPRFHNLAVTQALGS